MAKQAKKTEVKNDVTTDTQMGIALIQAGIVAPETVSPETVSPETVSPRDSLDDKKAGIAAGERLVSDITGKEKEVAEQHGARAYQDITTLGASCLHYLDGIADALKNGRKMAKTQKGRVTRYMLAAFNAEGVKTEGDTFRPVFYWQENGTDKACVMTFQSPPEKVKADKPDAVKPDAVKPDAVKPDADKPDAAPETTVQAIARIVADCQKRGILLSDLAAAGLQ